MNFSIYRNYINNISLMFAIPSTLITRAARFASGIRYPDRPRRYPDFEQLLGKDAWRRLPPAVRARFDSHHGRLEATVYAGRMTAVRASRAGLWLARWCTLFGTPIVPLIGRDVPIYVRLFHVARHCGIAWERIYCFQDHPIIAVRSTKMLDRDGGLIESLGCGLRMPLKLDEVDGALHFMSQGYYFQWGRLRIPLPRWFPPGTTTIIHRDLGGGRFCFILKTDHPLLGEMFYQEGYFEDGEAP